MFLPTVKLVTNILKILKKQSVGKTELLKLTKNNHTSVTIHLKWLIEKKFVKAIIEDNKIVYGITDLGRNFLETLSDSLV